LILAVAGAAVLVPWRGVPDALGFLGGGLFSLVSLRAWIRVSDSLGTRIKPPAAGLAGVFLAVRYVLIALAIYAIVNLLGISPVAMIVGLLASFAAVVIELLYVAIVKK
jgi:hypothetical protein